MSCASDYESVDSRFEYRREQKSEVRKFISIITTIYIPSKGIKCYKFV